MDAKVKSLAKAMEVLECFSLARPELGVTEIAGQTGLHKSSVHNILTTFEQMGYVHKNPQTNRYMLGYGLLSFSRIITNHMGIGQVMLPYLRKISQTIREISYLGIPAGPDVLYLDAYEDTALVVNRNILGERAPLYCTGLGKAMLAYHEDPLSMLPQPMQAFTDATITSPDALMQDLAQTRARGYAIDNMEHEYGVKCVAVPVFGTNQQVCCAVSVSGPSLRFPTERYDNIATCMMDILRDVQGKL